MLQKFQSNEMAWLTVDKILMQAQNLMSKFLALQILDETIKVSVIVLTYYQSRWQVLPDEDK